MNKLKAINKMDININTASVMKRHKEDLSYDFMSKWLSSNYLPVAKIIEDGWNNIIENITIDRLLTSESIMHNSEDLFSTLLNLFNRANNFNGLYSRLITVSNVIINQLGSVSLLDFTDTPSTYSSQANKFLGVNSNQEIAFLYPKPDTQFHELSDAPSSVPYGRSFLVNNGSTDLEWRYAQDYYIYQVSHINWSGLIDTLSVSGPSENHTVYQLDIGSLANNTSFIVTLSPISHGGMVTIKTIAGETNAAKYIEADTGAGVTLNGGYGAGSVVLDVDKSDTFIYSTQSTSFYRISGKA